MPVTSDSFGSSTRPVKRAVTVEQSRQGYRLFAPVYDLVFGLGLQHGRRVAIEALCCRPGDRILEVGVGSGLSLPLYPTGVRVTGIDISNEMLGKAAERVRRQHLSQTEALLQMDAQRLDFADDSFDKAVVMFAASGLPDPVRAMRELQRVCKPGAIVVVANHFKSQRPLMRFFDFVLTPIYRLLRYRDDLDLAKFTAEARLQVAEVKRANLLGYSTVLVCRNRSAPVTATPEPADR